MTSTIHRLDHTGDTSLEWDTETGVGVDAATAFFQKALGEGCMAVMVMPDDKRTKVQIRDFDQTAEQIILVPPMVGG